MSKQKKTRLLPALRFPEYQDKSEWEEKALFQVCEINPSANGLPETFVYIDLESVEAGRLLQKKIISREGAPSRAQRLLSRGDVVFQMVRPYQKNNYFFQPNDDLDYVASTGYAQLRAFESSMYLFQYLHNDRFVDRVLAKCTGSNYPAINSSDLSEILVEIPKPKEQQKIAGCLAAVDELINAQTQKIDALKTHKKGLMQQLFPAEGETVPKLRFPEFRDKGEWIEANFGSLRLDVSDGNYSSKYPKQSDFLESGIPFLRANNLRFGSVSDEDMRFISEEQHSELTKGHLKKGDILISTRGELGTLALVPDRHIGSNINAQLVRINAVGKLDYKFLFQLLDFSRTIGAFDRLSTGTALKQLPIGKLNQLSLLIPKLKKEQQKIADCLTSIDELITVQANKIAALKAHKKGLMQQLFPAMDEEGA